MRRKPEDKQLISVARGDLAALQRRVEQLEEENLELRRIASTPAPLAQRHSVCLATQLLRARRELRQRSKTAVVTEQSLLRLSDHLLDLEQLLGSFPANPADARAALQAHYDALRGLLAHTQKENAEAGFSCVAELRTSQADGAEAVRRLSVQRVEDLALCAGAVLECEEVPVELREAFYTLLDFSLALSEMLDKADKAKFRTKLQPLLAGFLERLRLHSEALGVLPSIADGGFLPGPVYLKCDLRRASQPNILALTLGQGRREEGERRDGEALRRSLASLEGEAVMAVELCEELKNLLGRTGKGLAAGHLAAKLLGSLGALKQLIDLVSKQTN